MIGLYLIRVMIKFHCLKIFVLFGVTWAFDVPIGPPELMLGVGNNQRVSANFEATLEFSNITRILKARLGNQTFTGEDDHEVFKLLMSIEELVKTSVCR